MDQNLWLEEFAYDPIDSLVNSNNPSIQYFTRRDLLDENMPHVDCLWELTVPVKSLKKQQEDGSWKYPNAGKLESVENYNQLETFRQLGELIEKYGFNGKHPQIRRAAEYLFNCQTEEGDFEEFTEINTPSPTPGQ